MKLLAALLLAAATAALAAEAERFPKGLKATFSGSTERSLSFSVSIPVSGTYYVPQPKPAPRQPGMEAT